MRFSDCDLGGHMEADDGRETFSRPESCRTVARCKHRTRTIGELRGCPKPGAQLPERRGQVAPGAELRPSFDQLCRCWPNIGQPCQLLGKFGQHLVASDQKWTVSAKFGQQIAKLGGRHWPSLANVCPAWAQIGKRCFRVGQIWPNVGYRYAGPFVGQASAKL